MKTITVQQVPQQWPEILTWVAAGEEVQVVNATSIIARIIPPMVTPDFLSRAKAIWGEHPPGKALSSIISESRDGEI